jgi:hypothetical protein
MIFLVVPLRSQGKAIDQKVVRTTTPIRGDLRIEVNHSEELGRQSRTATLWGPAPLDDVRRLFDAEVNSMAPRGMVVTGVEFIEGAAYAQSWWCRTE